MADSPTHRWYPTPDSPRQDTDRIIFDNIYELQDSMKESGSPSKEANPAMSGTLVISGNFNIGGKVYTRMTFADGKLVGVS